MTPYYARRVATIAARCDRRDGGPVAKRPTLPKADARTAAWFTTVLPDDPRIVIRPMFGHAAAFINGHMFAGTFGTEVFVRLDDQARRELLGVEGAKRFEPMKGRRSGIGHRRCSRRTTSPTCGSPWPFRGQNTG